MAGKILLKAGYIIDKKQIYHYGKKLNIEYPKTFEILGCNYTKDEKKHIL